MIYSINIPKCCYKIYQNCLTHIYKIYITVQIMQSNTNISSNIENMSVSDQMMLLINY